MINSIDEYLAQLRNELSDSDRATVQDAQSDAEEYLRTAVENARKAQLGLSEADVLPAIIEKYGTPDEIAAAYKNIETRVRPGLPPAAIEKRRSPLLTFIGVIGEPRAWAALFYLLFSLITGITYFTWTITGISISAGLIVLIVGVPFFGLFILSVRGLALVEGRIVEALLGVRMPRRARFSEMQKGLWAKFKGLVSDRFTWFSMAYMILMLPLGVVYFTVFVTFIAVDMGFIALPIAQAFGVPAFDISGTKYFVPGWLAPVLILGGFIGFVLTMHLAKWTGKMHSALAKALLVRG